ncbi:helix-turn-helix domain-containing protein [Lysinibacillus sphaericus]|uniref:Helix-turn-helix domain n=1 Tax=Lysinibacillus sphaericus TaxID=1421 RepID=A0A2S0K081_LYSSH|nr:helix-turn-helix domain-containing protein [Lysinibacillus sphaericus]AVK96795.1 helix-turn-helix domain-containing protein [Lysinibacillus sphaericus]TKI16697.1 helix-turn-helix domain-containing protein [Lysinibacillus sphaericus]GEC83870.1 hypothetical protein LSP03_36130 [Lysinibacillus sphaericus]SUV17382.1 Helix-turn-helix domain [Lysinibacillus sphaericus]
MKEYKVKEVADLLDKHEETIKRWIRSGKFPNAYRNSDKELMIPVSEFEQKGTIKPEVNTLVLN